MEFEMNPSYRDLPGIHASPNIQTAPDLYEVENRAADPDQLVEEAVQAIAGWSRKTVRAVHARGQPWYGARA
jgi:hypothetical protein